MVRKSNQLRNDLFRAIGEAVQAFQDATDEVDESVARVLELNRTDLRCLSILWRSPVTASELAALSGLTRGAMTTVLDRIEARGFARRIWDQQDRRSVRVELTEAARKQIEGLYGALAQEGLQVLQQYTTEELEGIRRYLEEGHALQRAHAERIRQRHGADVRPVEPQRAVSGRMRSRASKRR